MEESEERKEGMQRARACSSRGDRDVTQKFPSLQDTLILNFWCSMHKFINIKPVDDMSIVKCHSRPEVSRVPHCWVWWVIAGAIEKPQSIEDFRQGRSDEGERGRPRWRAGGWHRSSRRRTSRRASDILCLPVCTHSLAREQLTH